LVKIMSDENNITISTDILEQLYQEFVQFIKAKTNEDFISFKKSNYVDEQEHYKYSISDEAKRNLRISEWKPNDIGTGKIQKAVKSAMVIKVNHKFRNIDNNLINWRKINDFSKIVKNKELEQLFFDFFKNKISPKEAFERLTKHFDYQLIAYLFFIKDYNQFLPISQEAFDEIFSDKLHIHNFRTSRRMSWENYKTFIEIIRQIHRYLRTKDKDATLLDAHSFLWILGRQREDWLKSISKEKITFQSKTVNSENLQAVRMEDEPDQIILTETEELEKNQFTPADIVWIKNVNNKEKGRAYMDLSDDEFILHFPNHHKGNILSPQIGEIILLRQRINDIAVFTHLVTPIDNETFDDNERPDYRYGRRVRLIANTPIDKLIEVASTKWENINFSGISQGNACKIENIKDIGQIDDLQLEIWERFRPFFVEDNFQSIEITNALLKEIEITDPDLSVTEGKLKLVSHYQRERNSEIVRLKKQQAIKEQNLKCEVCGFSFRESYEVDFIECHHRTPISQTGVTRTKLEDLALVCANCHRMLHKKIDGKFLSTEELRYRLKVSFE
jgi:5-methylcytosine-specific restriction enzyme A